MKASHDAAEIILPSEYDMICGQGDKSQEKKKNDFMMLYTCTKRCIINQRQREKKLRLH